MFLVKSKLNSIKVLICKALINSVLSHDEFVLINKCSKRILQNKRRNRKFKYLNSLLKVLVYFQNNVIVLFEV